MELYIDIVREVIVTPTRFAFVDLYVDVLLKNGEVRSKDEELVSRLAPEEARSVIATRDALLASVRAGTAPWFMDHARWRVSEDVRALVPGVELTL
jgi:predicted RNA-binding protein associated with RNAse of E/G family